MSSIAEVLLDIAPDAAHALLELVEIIAGSADQKQAIERAKRALIADAADLATDEALRIALGHGGTK